MNAVIFVKNLIKHWTILLNLYSINTISEILIFLWIRKILNIQNNLQNTFF